MKILLINNHTKHLTELSTALAGHDLEIRDYRPGLDFSCADKDLIVLSGGGGEGLEIHDEHQPGRLWYEDQMKFVRVCQTPLIGICMGFEVISRAFGSKVEKLPQGLEEFVTFQATKKGEKLFGKKHLKQFEAHDWAVQYEPSEFEALARSQTGIEIIRHRSRPIIATQFHPEKGGTLQIKSLISANLASASSRL